MLESFETLKQTEAQEITENETISQQDDIQAQIIRQKEMMQTAQRAAQAKQREMMEKSRVVALKAAQARQLKERELRAMQENEINKMRRGWEKEARPLREAGRIERRREIQVAQVKQMVVARQKQIEVQKNLKIISLTEIRKNSRVLAQACRTNTSFFAWLPKELNCRISAITGNSNVHDEVTSAKIALDNFCKPTLSKNTLFADTSDIDISDDNEVAIFQNTILDADNNKEKPDFILALECKNLVICQKLIAQRLLFLIANDQISCSDTDIWDFLFECGGDIHQHDNEFRSLFHVSASSHNELFLGYLFETKVQGDGNEEFEAVDLYGNSAKSLFENDNGYSDCVYEFTDIIENKDTLLELAKLGGQLAIFEKLLSIHNQLLEIDLTTVSTISPKF